MPAPERGEPRIAPTDRLRPTLETQQTLGEGRYELGRMLGAGGMGIVRQARDRLLDRTVAVKLLADNLAADPVARERFLREARAAARIVHPNVVAVYDVASEGDRPYLVMEFVDGPSLSDVVASARRLPASDVVDIAVDALAGLERAHQVGLLHRDVKPGNLLRGRDGTVKVTDFGVAEAADAPGLTRTGTVVGTRAYLSPERRLGDPATAASDLYSLGVTLGELVSGEPPEADAPPMLPADAPSGLRRLLAALLASDADRRPADVAEARAILAGAPPRTATTRSTPRRARPTPPLPEPVTAPPSRRSTDRRRPVVKLLGAVVSVAALAGGAFTFALGARAADEPAPVVERVADDPAGTARNLAEWLRGQADG